MSWFSDPDRRVAAGLFVLSLVVYAITMSPTISFWDCAEFTATSYTLGIPHQPGTPLYVLVGRVFTLLPFIGGTIAAKINFMSAFFSALAVAFMFLTGVRLQRLWKEEQENPSPEWLVRAGAATGALFLAFSTTFWNSAIEAEVYALASFTMAFASYLAVLWYEVRSRLSSAMLMLLIVYLMGMSVGFHMGSILVFPGIVLMALVSDRKALSNTDILIVFSVWVLFVLWVAMKAPQSLAVIGLLLTLVAAAWRSMTWGEKDEISHNRWFAFAGIALFLAGLSVHFFMMIRAHQDPLINQTDPTTWKAMISVLQREQYPPRSIFHREAPLLWQLGHLWGTSVWQTGQLAGRQVVGYIQQFTFLPYPTLIDRVLPLLLWLMGIVYQMSGNWRVGISFLTTLLINSIGLMVLLNFTDGEVRDRDYFYFGFYQFAALFLGLGVGGLLRQIWFGAREWARPLARAGAVFLLALPLLPVLLGPFGLHPKWFEHDRSRNWIPYYYAKNILDSLPPDAILCTNGDNDTFPLWYLQEVEHHRQDVRVVNLSLINLPWYIKQLRDYEPRVPIAWNDAQIDGEEDIIFRKWRTRLEAQRLPDNSVVWVRDITVWHMVQQNQWKRPIYYAVTVPNENIGMFVPYLEMEGVVYRLTQTRSDDGNPRVNTEKIWKNFTEVYDFTSVLDANGQMDQSIYRDPQTAHLLQNYPAALARVGYFEALDGNYDRALEALERAYAFNPGFSVVADIWPIVCLQAGRVDAAIEAGRKLLPYQAAPWRGGLELAEALLQMEEAQKATEWARELVDHDPDSVEYVQVLVRSLIYADRMAEAERVIDDWAARSGDLRAREEFERFRSERQRRVPAPPDSGSAPVAPEGGR